MSKGALLKQTALVSLLTLVSRISGFVRDAVIAFAFGTQASADVFYVAFRIPNLLRRLFAEGALVQAFIPVFGETLARDKDINDDSKIPLNPPFPKGEVKIPPLEKGARGICVPRDLSPQHLVNSTFTVLLGVLIVIVGAGLILSPYLVMAIAWGFRTSPEKLALTISLTRVMFPYIALVSLMGLAMGILNSFKRFAAPAAAPIVLNLAMIIGAVGLSRIVTPPVMGLAIAVLLGGVMQLVCQIPSLYRVGMLPRLQFSRPHPQVRHIARLMLPSIYGAAVYQLTVLVTTFFASFLPSGAVSALWYAGRIAEFPLGLFAIALSTTLLPSLSTAAAIGEREKFKQSLLFGFESIQFIMIPSAIGLFALALPITTLLLHRGQFNGESVYATAHALQALAIGLPFVGASRILASAYYALKRPRFPAVMTTISLFTTVIGCLFLKSLWGHVGLAMAMSGAAIVNAIGLFWGLRKIIEGGKNAIIPLVKILLKGMCMYLILLLFYKFIFTDLLQLSTTSLALTTGAAIITGVATYALLNLRHPLFKEFVTRLYKKTPPRNFPH